MSRPRLLLVIALLSSTGCRPSPPDPADPGYHPLDRAEDLDPADGVFEVDLVADQGTVEIRQGVESQAWLYSGMFPGPLIEANLGDTLRVHFRNELGMTTTVHWHGLRVPATMDGTTVMMDPVPPSGGTFEYEFELRDAGLFWYHPHLGTDVAMEKGLYGVILVRDPSEPEELGDLPEDILVLDDVGIRADGTIDTPSGMDSVDGLEGSTMLVNGRPDAVLPMRSGAIRRWRLLNAASARYFKLELDGHVFRVIGTDGGRVEEPYETASLLLTPGERYDVLIRGVAEPGTELPLKARRYDRGQMHGVDGDRVVATVRYSGAKPLEQGSYPPTTRTIERIFPDPGTAPIRSLVIDETTGGFAINGALWPNVTPIDVPYGTSEIWRLDNRSGWDHPFHLHGNFFQPVLVDGAVPPVAWKDTVNVVRGTVTDVAIRHDNPGRWMYHCHILGHAEDLGMMGELVVGAPESSSPAQHVELPVVPERGVEARGVQHMPQRVP